MLFNKHLNNGKRGNRLGGLRSLRRFKLGAKHFVPKTTRYAKAVLVVCVVVLEMVLFELFVEGWKAAIHVKNQRTAQMERGIYLLWCKK